MLVFMDAKRNGRWYPRPGDEFVLDCGDDGMDLLTHGYAQFVRDIVHEEKRQEVFETAAFEPITHAAKRVRNTNRKVRKPR